MRSQIVAVFLIGLVAIHALPVPEEADAVMSDPVADIAAPENLEPKSIAQEQPENLEPKSIAQEEPENLEAKSIAQEQPENLEPQSIAQDESVSLEPKAVLSVQNSLEPIAEEMRSVISSANGAINDIAEEVKSAAARALDYAKELTAPLNGAERANVASSLAERALDVYGKMQADAKNLLERTLQNTDSLQLSGRSIIPTFGDITRTLLEKYLTADGQQLAKVLLSFGNME